MAAYGRGGRAKRGSKSGGWRQILELAASEWAIEVLLALDRSPKLYPEMKRELRGAPHAALAQTLRNLQDGGLVWRKAYATSPPREEYSLTSLGRNFIAPLQELCRWADQHERELGAAAVRRVRKGGSAASKKKRST